MALLLTSRLRFLDTAGAPLDYPREWEPALIEVLDPPHEWDAVLLQRQGVALPLYLKHLAGERRLLADWPRAGPGNYLLRLSSDGDIEERTILLRSRKLGPAAFDPMLHDLSERLPAQIALALQRTGALAGVHFVPPQENTVAQEVERLRRAVRGVPGRPGLAAVLTELARDPHVMLRGVEPWTPREQARRPHPARLTLAVARGGNMDSDRRLVQVLDTRVEHSADTYENRLLAVFHKQVDGRLRRLLAAKGAALPEDVRATAVALQTELQRARQQATFLNGVPLPAHLPDQITMVLLKRPPYRAALEGWLEFHRVAVVRLDTPALDAPLENTPHLYELWGTLEVLAAALTVAADLGYTTRNQQLVHRGPDGWYVRVLPGGRPAVVLVHPVHGTVVRVIPQRYYGKRSGYHSISFEQRPDIAIEMEPPDGPPAIVIFDPKYKLDSEGEEPGDGGPQKGDIDKMHAYRDAIRDAEGRRVVTCASILYPGRDWHANGEVAAVSAVPGAGGALAAELARVLRDALTAVPARHDALSALTS